MKFDFKELIQTYDERRDIAILETKELAINFSVEHFIKLAQAAIDHHGYFAVALSGGSTPKAIYELLAQKGNRERILWDRVLLFWSDERCVPPEDPDSNYRMAMDAGFSTLNITPEHIFRMQGEEDPEEEARRYNALIKKEVPLDRFDLIMLGMGEDGHTASLFPKTHALHSVGHLATANYIPQKECWRLTMTYECINTADNIAIYVLGGSKAEMVEKVLTSPFDPDTYPIQKVGLSTNKALWILDSGAAAKLP